MKISYIGMKAQEVSIKPGTMKIVMQPDAEVLDEVVVTGMTKVDKRLFTGAADRLTAASVKLDGLPDISRGLEGRSAGVSVQNVSGTFGTAPKIRVRGATSIYGNSKPLWVVDGIIVQDPVPISAEELNDPDYINRIGNAIAGRFVMEDWHNFGADYDKTLMAWAENFRRGREEGKFSCSESVFRMFHYYLLSCAGAFRARDLQLWQIVLSPHGAVGGYRRP